MRTLSITTNNINLGNIYRDINIKILNKNNNIIFEQTLYCIDKIINLNGFVNNDELLEFGSNNTNFSLMKKNENSLKKLKNTKNITASTKFSIMHGLINPIVLAEIKFTGKELSFYYNPCAKNTFDLNEIELKQFKKEFYKLNEFYYINKIIKWYKHHKKIKILWKIAEYYTKKKYSPENIIKYINLD